MQMTLAWMDPSGLISHFLQQLNMAGVVSLDHVNELGVILAGATTRLDVLNHCPIKIKANDKVAIRHIKALLSNRGRKETVQLVTLPLLPPLLLLLRRRRR